MTGKNITILLFVLVFTSCLKEEVKQKINYNQFTSEMGSEGGEINFFRCSSDIPDSVFPVMNIPKGTFNKQTVINLYVKRIGRGNFPIELTALNEENFLWYFSIEESLQIKPVEIHFSYLKPLDNLMLSDYEYLFELFRIPLERDICEYSNWDLVENFKLDTSRNKIKAEIFDFNFMYCVLFREIKQNDNFILELSGDFTKIIQGGHGDYATYCFSNLESCGSFYYYQGFSHYEITQIINNSTFNMNFSFKGKMPKFYNDKYTKVELVTNISGKFMNYRNSDTIAIDIYEYGNIGENIEGKIYGNLYANNKNKLSITMDFVFIRIR